MSSLGYTSRGNSATAILDSNGVDTMASLTKKNGKTRGKNPREITYEAFDLEKPETLPKTLKEFMETTKTTEESAMVGYVVDGFNLAQYSAASDEIGEFINDYWDDDTQGQFRLIVRNYAKAANKSIEEAANLMKPAIEAGFQARKTAAAQAPPATT